MAITPLEIEANVLTAASFREMVAVADNPNSVLTAENDIAPEAGSVI
jgi:hypothetical protein